MSRQDEGFGHWHEWREDSKYGQTIGFGNTKLKRVGKCHWETLDEALAASKQLDFQADKAGDRIVTPTGLTERQLSELK